MQKELNELLRNLPFDENKLPKLSAAQQKKYPNAKPVFVCGETIVYNYTSKGVLGLNAKPKYMIFNSGEFIANLEMDHTPLSFESDASFRFSNNKEEQIYLDLAGTVSKEPTKTAELQLAIATRDRDFESDIPLKYFLDPKFVALVRRVEQQKAENLAVAQTFKGQYNEAEIQTLVDSRLDLLSQILNKAQAEENERQRIENEKQAIYKKGLELANSFDIRSDVSEILNDPSAEHLLQKTSTAKIEDIISKLKLREIYPNLKVIPSQAFTHGNIAVLEYQDPKKDYKNHLVLDQKGIVLGAKTPIQITTQESGHLVSKEIDKKGYFISGSEYYISPISVGREPSQQGEIIAKYLEGVLSLEDIDPIYFMNKDFRSAVFSKVETDLQSAIADEFWKNQEISDELITIGKAYTSLLASKLSKVLAIEDAKTEADNNKNAVSSMFDSKSME